MSAFSPPSVNKTLLVSEAEILVSGKCILLIFPLGEYGRFLDDRERYRGVPSSLRTWIITISPFIFLVGMSIPGMYRNIQTPPAL